MEGVSFTYKEQSTIDPVLLRDYQKQLQPAMDIINREQSLGYTSSYASLFMLSDQGMLNDIKNMIAQKKTLNPAILIVIGIGGSNLGTCAVHTAVGKPGMPVYYADTVDPDRIHSLLAVAEKVLQERKNVLLTIISKSGSTAETIINAALFVALLKRYRPHDYHHFIVVITETNNRLWTFAQEESWSTLVVPQQVGGRFSVFSAVGLFPLGMLDVAIEDLAAGALQMCQHCLADGDENFAAISASLLYAAYQQGFFIHDFFPFSVDLVQAGMWYRQLLAESIGKEYTIDGRRVSVGITPTVSVGSTDLHSMVELHLGGPRTTFTTFVAVKKRQHVVIPHDLLIKKLLPYATDKSLALVMDALMQGTQRAYKKKELPFVTITMPEKSAFCIGQLLQWKMMEIIYLGSLFNVNPFEQPQVELYKRETRAILNDE
jgi:glucose-6-phosphate isomerase